MEEKPRDFDDFMEQYVGFSRYQIFLCIGAFWLAYSTEVVAQIAIFLSGVPDFRCSIPALDNPECDVSESEIKKLIPFDEKMEEYETCIRYEVNVTSCGNIPNIGPNTGTIRCTDGYHYDYTMCGETTITLWNLVCDRSLLDAMANSVFFAGFFVGSWTYGPLSDWYGRKLPMVVYCIFFIVFVVAIAFIPVFEAYVALRFFAGAATIAAYVAVFTYVGAAAHATLPGLAYALKDWRHLELVCGILPVVFIPTYFFLKESPRWLLAVDREEEAKMIVTRFAQSSKKAFTEEEWNKMVQVEKNKVDTQNTSSSSDKKYSILDLFKYSRTRIVTLSVMCNWFTSSLVFYGLSLNVGNLAGDPYQNAAINAAIEVLGTGMILLAPFLEKRVMLAFSFLFCGFFCIASTVCVELAGDNQHVANLGVAMAMIGKCGISGAFILTYSTTADAFPTVVRGTGISLGSMAARIGSIITPFTIELQKQVPWLTQTLFGLLAIVSFFPAIILPKTMQAPSLTLIEEAEDFYKESMTTWNRFSKLNFMKRRGSISKKVLSEDFDNPIENPTDNTTVL